MALAREDLLRVARLPGRVVESVSDSIFGFLEDYLLRDQIEFAEDRIRTLPLHEIEIGRKALKASGKALEEAIALSAAGRLLGNRQDMERADEKRKEAEVFRNIGYGTMKKAVVRAVTDEAYAEHVPEHIVKEAVQRSINLGADPELNGFLKPEESEQVSEVFDKFNNITILPIGK